MAVRLSRACGHLAVALGLLLAADAFAQLQPAGVQVDPDGVLRLRTFHNDLTRQRLEAARAGLDPELAKASPLRKVSLNRLEAALAEQLRTGATPSAEMLHLAGLTRVRYVFFYPETGDVVLAGPAEGFVTDASGRAVGLETGQAILLLEDVVAALRAYPPTGQKTAVISVSIDPTAEGLARMQQFLNNIAGRVGPGDANRIVEGLRQSLGLQSVSIRGVSPRTHFAQVLVEADYRMKLIGIGIEKPSVKIVSYVERANPRDISRNALQRWYFTPNYECVRVSEDELALELVGDGVKLINSDELVQAGGVRADSANANKASKAFTENFTAMYTELAARTPVYAQLRNLIDIAVAAAYIQQQDFYAQADWQAPVFGDEAQFAIEKHQAPEQVETACTAIWKGNTLMTPIGGGVNIQPRIALQQDFYAQADWQASVFGDEAQFAIEKHQAPEQVETACTAIWKGNTLMTPIGGGVNIQPRIALQQENRLADENGQLQALRQKIEIRALPKDNWWWD